MQISDYKRFTESTIIMIKNALIYRRRSADKRTRAPRQNRLFSDTGTNPRFIKRKNGRVIPERVRLRKREDSIEIFTPSRSIGRHQKLIRKYLSSAKGPGSFPQPRLDPERNRLIEMRRNNSLRENGKAGCRERSQFKLNFNAGKQLHFYEQSPPKQTSSRNEAVLKYSTWRF